MSRLGTGTATNASSSGGGGNVNITQVGSASFALGQALAAASLPVVLTAAQITTLTPVAAITNYALETGGNLASVVTALQLIDNAVSGSGFNITQFAGVNNVTGSGTATGALRVELPTNGTGVVGLNAGTNNIGQVSVAPQTANGLSVFNGTSSDGGTALTNTAQVIKASAGQVYGWYIYNPNAIAQFVQLYNTAQASVTVGTTAPLFMLTIPATSAANVEFTNGITFSNAGFSTAATSTAAGNGAPTTALDAVIFYK